MKDEKCSDEFSHSTLSLTGIGPKTHQELSQIGIHSLFDLLLTLPKEFIDKSVLTPLSEIKSGDKAVVIGTIIKSVRTKSVRPNYIITLQTGSEKFVVRFIHKIIIFKNLVSGVKVRVTGTANIRSGIIEFIHPEIEVIKDQMVLDDVIPRYSTKGTIGQQKFRKIIKDAFQIVSRNYKLSILDKYFHDTFNSMSYLMALKKIHFPTNDYEVACIEYKKAYERIIFEEFYLNKHEILQTIKKTNKKESYSLKIDTMSFENFLRKLPFSLTAGQAKAIENIHELLTHSSPTKTLIQGDVGCGKTLIAVLSCLQFIRNNLQCIILVPTEILCHQHYVVFDRYLGEHGFVEKLSAKSSHAEKNKIKEGLKSGSISILIGTHAILYDDYNFRELGLVLIDEQHKFGVKQRELISTTYDKTPHQILMSATPIPRTLALVLYENMNYIKIEDRPRERKTINTITHSSSNRNSLIQTVTRHLKDGMQVYWVCTRVEDTMDDQTLSVKMFINVLKNEFPNYRIEMLHGKLAAEQKVSIINLFKTGKVDILVTTSVIEVGVDCPNANCLVIENSELFGLAQLHQLRGRVGRGGSQGYCYLVYNYLITKQSIEKLKYLEHQHSGFKIAEYDLANRGAGSYFGTKQSGMPDNYRVSTINDIMDSIFSIKKFKYELSSSEIDQLKKRWNIKSNDDIQL